MRLAGKTAFVTGAGRGIGLATALKLAGDGARIVLNDLDPETTEAAVALVRARGGEAIGVSGSVSEADFGERFIVAGTQAFGGVDIVVNNAGYTWDALAHKMTDAQFDAMLDVHVKAPFRILRAAGRFIIPAAAAEGGAVTRKVVNVSSVSGTAGNPGQANYSSAKAAILGLTRTLAKEWGRHRVCVNAVAFGVIATRLTAPTEVKEMVEVDGNRVGLGVPVRLAEGLAAAIPLGRPGTVDEAAGAIWTLCIPESDYISGQTVVVAGGLSL